jgi:hypothetical protein
MYAAIAISCAATMIAGFFLFNFAIKWRMNISFASLIGGSICLPVGGFIVSEAVGFFTLAGVLLMIAILFGYDSRGA